MIVSHDEIEYSGIIQDVIKTLKGKKSFFLHIWVDGTEIPYMATEMDDIEFLHESIKISHDDSATWILYGIIMVFRVVGK